MAVVRPVSMGSGFSYTWPNSPGAKERVEQNPSDELIRTVNPSCDLEEYKRLEIQKRPVVLTKSSL